MIQSRIPGRFLAGLALAAMTTALPAKAETKAYVVSWFGVSTYFGGEEDCPEGMNPMSTDFYRRELLRIGKTPEEATALLKDFPGMPGQPDGKYIDYMIHRGDNKQNAYANPTSVPDPGLKTIKGQHAYGFNLDGKTDSPISFTDPDTGEKGIKNQLYRVLGCVRSFRAPPPAHPTLAQAQWDVLRDEMPAWIIEVSGITDPKNSPNVQVELYRATQHISRDASGGVRSDMSYKVDPDPRSHNVLRGSIKDGMLVTEASNIRMVVDPFLIPEYNWHQARLKLKMNPDGTLKGILGGYHDWYALYWGNASSGWVEEHSASLDMPAFYYALKRNADASPDPKTGENKEISTAFEVEAVPAFVIHTEDKNDKKVSALPEGQQQKNPQAQGQRIEANLGSLLR